ncbi:MAG TPA: hypothetical protein V6D18_09430 [Thermosynechococcaceae cyanobacterium]
MPSRKLSDSDKQQVIERYRSSNETAAILANQYGVSNSTISRLLKAGLPEAEYEALIQQKRGRSTGEATAGLESVSLESVSPEFVSLESASSEPVSSEPVSLESVSPEFKRPVLPTDADLPQPEPSYAELTQPEATQPDESLKTIQPPSKLEAPTKLEAPIRRVRKRSSAAELNSEPELQPEPQLEPLGLAPAIVLKAEAVEAEEIEPEAVVSDRSVELNVLEEILEEEISDDQDDLDSDLDSDLDDLDEDEDGDDEPLEDGALLVSRQGRSNTQMRVLPLTDASIPRTCYLVVDRSAELVARPLREFGDLGSIPDEETQAKTLPVFDNHRVAKRYSNPRTQRVIKLPDGRVLQKTSSHLQAKGITRLLIDGQVYSFV